MCLSHRTWNCPVGVLGLNKPLAPHLLDSLYLCPWPHDFVVLPTEGRVYLPTPQLWTQPFEFYSQRNVGSHDSVPVPT